MRLTDFWERMRDTFGPHAETLVELHVFTELGNRTPAQALAAASRRSGLARGLRGHGGPRRTALSGSAGV